MKTLLRVGGALLLAAGLAGCGGAGGEPEPDTTAPQVLRTEPAAGAVGVDPGTRLRVWFDEPVDNQRAVWDDQLYLLRPDGVAMYGNGSYDLQARQATLALAADLLPGTTYEAVLERGVCDLAGNCTTAAHRWSFTIAD